MKNLISKLKCEIINGNACYLVALIESEGSTPRSSGAYMLVNKNGWVAGTVGGGGMEYAAVCTNEIERFSIIYDWFVV